MQAEPGATNGSDQPARPALAQLALLVPDASFAIARDLQRAALGVLRFGAQWSAAAAGAVASTPVVARPLALVEARVESLARQGAEQRRADSTQFAVVLQRTQPMLEEFLQWVVEILPVEALLARVDVDALVRRVDADALVRRVDVDAIVERVDLERIVPEVLAGIEIGDLIHDSTNGVVSDVRDTVRSGVASVDGRLARIVDRIVRRGRERDVVMPGYAINALP